LKKLLGGKKDWLAFSVRCRRLCSFTKTEKRKKSGNYNPARGTWKEEEGRARVFLRRSNRKGTPGGGGGGVGGGGLWGGEKKKIQRKEIIITPNETGGEDALMSDVWLRAEQTCPGRRKREGKKLTIPKRGANEKGGIVQLPLEKGGAEVWSKGMHQGGGTSLS